MSITYQQLFFLLGFAVFFILALALFVRPASALKRWEPVPLDRYLDFPYKPMEESSVAHHRMYHAAAEAWIESFSGILGSHPPRVWVDKGGQSRASIVMYLHAVPTNEQVSTFYSKLSEGMRAKWDVDISIIPAKSAYVDHDDYVNTFMKKQTYYVGEESEFRVSPGIFNAEFDPQ